MTVSLTSDNAESFSDTVERFRGDRILSRASGQILARVLAYAVPRSLDQGATLYRAGSAARELYLVLEGEIDLVGADGYRLIPREGRVGQEAATDVPHYLTGAVARSAVRILAISRSGLQILLVAHPELSGLFHASLMESLEGRSSHDNAQVTEPVPQVPERNWTLVLGWSLAILLPAIVLLLGGDWALPRNTLYFVAILSATLVMWVFNLTDEYVPGIFALLTTLAMGLVPVHVALGGLAGEGFVLAMSMIGLAALVVASGLGYRLLLLLLLKLPDRPFWHNVGLLCTGFVLTPLVPSVSRRVTLLVPWMRDMAEGLRCLPKGMGSTALVVSVFAGSSLLSSVFLSGKSVNFLVFGLLSDQIRDQFDWLQWTEAAVVAGIVIILAYSLLSAFMFRANEYATLSKGSLAAQLAVIGEPDRREWATIVAVLLFVMAVALSPIHRIQPAWIGLAILYGLLLFGMLGKNEFHKGVEWPFLMYVGGILGLTSTFHYLKLDYALVTGLPWLGEYMHTDFGLFLLALAVTVFLCRLIIPISATIVILATVLMPVADSAGVNPWVVGFSILMLGDMWFLPYQCSYYRQLRSMTHGSEFYDERTFLYLNAFSNLIKLGALYASIPYWKALGLL